MFFDDIKIASTNLEKFYFVSLELVLKRLSEYNVRINLEKYLFMKDQISYCGHIMGRTILKWSRKKIDAVEKLRRSINASELRASIWLINYYGRFIKI